MVSKQRWLTFTLLIVSCSPGAGEGPGVDGDADADTDADSDGDGDADRGHDAGALPDPGLADAAVCTDAVDVVLVLDVSSSMTFVLDSLEAEFARVVDAATALAPEPHFGLVAFVDDWAFDETGAAGRVHLDADTLRAAFRDLRRTYTDANRNPGDGPGGPTLQNPICEENALDALHAAATEFPWRDPSTRVVILVTDDTFLERPDNYGDRDGDGDTDRQDYPREGDYPATSTVAETVGALRDRLVRVFSFTRLTPPSFLDFTRCGTGRRLPWDDISDGWSTPYGDEPPIPDQTDGQNLDLDQVLLGQVSLADAITDIVSDSYCDPVDLF